MVGKSTSPYRRTVWFIVEYKTTTTLEKTIVIFRVTSSIFFWYNWSHVFSLGENQNASENLW